jgi:hypothetical protein
MTKLQAFWLGFLTMALLVIAVPWLLKNRGPLDDTDNKITGERSNMRILIDHGTGCQYLLGSQGGISPRMTAAGKPRCAAPALAQKED